MTSWYRWLTVAGLVVSAMGVADSAKAVTINFSEFPVGTVIDTQYSGLGVTFAVGSTTLPVIANDGAMPGSPVLSPNPPFSGDFYMFFTVPVSTVSFESGYWNDVGAGIIVVTDPFGALLEIFFNTTTGVELMTFSYPTGIGRVLFSSVGDPFGADIDNLTFEPLVEAVPEPGTLTLVGGGLVALARRIRRRSRRE